MLNDTALNTLFSGRRWREMIYPKIAEFIKDHA